METWYCILASLTLHAAVLGVGLSWLGTDGDAPPSSPAMSVRFTPTPMRLVAPADAEPTLADVQPPPKSPDRPRVVVHGAPPRAMIRVPSVQPRLSRNVVEVAQPRGWSLPAPVAMTASIETSAASDAAGASANAAGAELSASLPRYGQTPRPAYPSVAKANGWEGVTLLRVEVLETGRVGNVEILRSSNHKSLDDAATLAVRGWIFEPAHSGDRATACTIEVPIRFRLETR